MNAQLYGGITVDLNDGPIRTEYGRDLNGKPLARLVIGEGSESIAIAVSKSGPAVIAELQEAISELAAWSRINTVKQVA